MNRRHWLRTAVVGSSALFASKFLAGQGSDLTLQPLSEGFHVLMGAGGNITIFDTKDGLLVVDAGLPDTAPAVLAKTKSVADLPVKSLLNTHWHSDHTGGNVEFGKSGARITALGNTVKRLSVKQHMVFFNRDVEPIAAEGMPKEVILEKAQPKTGRTLNFGGQVIHLWYEGPAHTDGDMTVHFVKANVFSTGDLLFSGMYPFIDYSSGGSIEGMIRNSQIVWRMVDDRTIIVPGHGPIARRADVKAFHEMLGEVNESVSVLVKQGKGLDEVVAAGPTKKYDAVWGGGFVKPDAFVTMLYQGKTASS